MKVFSILPSKADANSALILGHVNSGMGERVLAYKMQKLMKEVGVVFPPTVDVLSLMGENYERFSTLNYDLADGGYALIEEIEQLILPQTDILLILSWSFTLAAVFATNLHTSRPTIAKLYAHHHDERVLSTLYSPADLLITESLLANERGAKYGIPQEKMLYFPHTYHEISVLPKKRSLKRVIGVVCRLEYGKNCEFAIEAVRQLVAQGEEVVLHLKGDFSEECLYPEYKQHLTEMLEAYKQEEWLIWDKTRTPFPEVVQEYACFDLLLHLSGAEGGAHVVVECLGLGIPCVVLNCSTNPFLFKGLATFVNTTGTVRHAQLPFYVPDMENLMQTLKRKIPAPHLEQVQERFHPDVAKTRVPLLFDRDPEKILAHYKQDCLLYGV